MTTNDSEPIGEYYYLKGMNEKKTADESFPNVPKYPSKNWTEDFPHENGYYQNRCRECKELFFGHKRRIICKECATPDWEKLALKQPPEEIKNNAWPGCWADGEMTGFARCMVKKVKPLEQETAALREKNERLAEKVKTLDTLRKEEFRVLSRENERLKEALKVYKENLKRAIHTIFNNQHSVTRIQIIELIDEI